MNADYCAGRGWWMRKFRNLNLIVWWTAFFACSFQLHGSTWQEDRNEELRQVLLVKDEEEKVTQLAAWFGRMSFSESVNEEVEKFRLKLGDQLTAQEKWGALLLRRIQKLSENEYSRARKGVPVYPELPTDGTIRVCCLNALGALRVVESVRVMGELLADEREPYDPEWIDKSGMMDCPPASASALYCQKRLGAMLEDRPVAKPDTQYDAQDLPAWQKWYQEVKSGQRTFRFKGNPRHYTLAGPVAESRSPAR